MSTIVKLIQKNLRKLLGIKDLNLSEQEALFYAQSPDGMNDSYLFDFENYNADREQRGSGIFIDSGIVVSGSLPDAAMQGEVVTPTTHTQVRKIKIKPIHVVQELEHAPSLFDLNNLNDKISVLKDKEKLIKQTYAKREVEALIERLENRKKFPEYKTYFDQFKNTTDEKITQLLNKYELVKKPSDIFIPEFPDEAIRIMKNYSEMVNKVCNKNPVFYVIAEDILFKKAYEKRDPILLVQSPFGFFWQILGAWDKEMIILQHL